MTDYITFRAEISPMQWGTSTSTVVHLPTAVETALGRTRRVEGEFADHPINLAITRAPVVPGAFLWAGKSLLDRTGLIPGDRFEARLRPAPNDHVEVPSDVTRALRLAGASEAWDALTPGQKRRQIHQIEIAKRAEIRAKQPPSFATLMMPCWKPAKHAMIMQNGATA